LLGLRIANPQDFLGDTGIDRRRRQTASVVVAPWLVNQYRGDIARRADWRDANK